MSQEFWGALAEAGSELHIRYASTTVHLAEQRALIKSHVPTSLCSCGKLRAASELRACAECGCACGAVTEASGIHAHCTFRCVKYKCKRFCMQCAVQILRRCRACGLFAVISDMERCHGCGSSMCSDCVARCISCTEAFLSCCSTPCSSCDEVVCDECSFDSGWQRYCSSCYEDEVDQMLSSSSSPHSSE